MAYYRELINELENIRSTIKHAPEHVNLEDIRGTLARAVMDLGILESLRRPDKLTIREIPDGLRKVVITMILDETEAEDVIRKLWVQDEN